MYKKSLNGVVVDMAQDEIDQCIANAAMIDAEVALGTLKLTRDIGRVAPITVGGRTFDADAIAQANIRAAIEEFSVLAPSGTMQWTLEDNTVVPVTLAELKAVKTAIVVRFAELHAAYTEAR